MTSALAQVRRLLLLIGAALIFALAVVVIVLAGPPARAVWLASVVVVVLSATALGWRAIGRNVASWGYTERAEDLLIRHGVLLRRLVVVPYGRMQFVDVHTGPLQRAFGLATVQLHTAAAASDASIPGLSPAEAARLRDRLAAFGEAQAAGL